MCLTDTGDFSVILRNRPQFKIISKDDARCMLRHTTGTLIVEDVNLLGHFFYISDGEFWERYDSDGDLPSQHFSGQAAIDKVFAVRKSFNQKFFSGSH